MAKLYFRGMFDDAVLSAEDVGEIRDALNLLSGVSAGKGFSFGMAATLGALTSTGRRRRKDPVLGDENSA